MGDWFVNCDRWRNAPHACACALTVAISVAAGAALGESLLFVGNSYLQDGGGVHRHAEAIARGVTPDHALSVTASTIRGSRLDEQDLGPVLAQGPFDRVVLQGHSTAALTDATRARFRAAVRSMQQAVSAQGGETVLYMTPAYTPAHPRHDPEMFTRIATEYTALGREIGAPVIPVGLAFEIAYSRRPGITLHQTDGSHHSPQGTYLSAATTATALFGIDPRHTRYDMGGTIAPEDAAFLQDVAAEAVSLLLAGHATLPRRELACAGTVTAQVLIAPRATC